MDLITQGVLGALLAQTQAKTKQLGKAVIIGGLAGMAPDLDVLIRSSSDPLLFLEFHRHFTHSLFFIPIGGLLCSLVLYPLLGKRWQLSYLQTLIWCLVGFATHGLLDGCTSYGTQLLWPLSNERFAGSFISIIDPLFTLPLMLFIYLAFKKSSRRYVVLGVLWMVAYLALGYIQHQRAINIGEKIAEERGHSVQRLTAKPSFGNLVVWKIIYESDGYFYIDAVKPGLFQSKVWQGKKLAILDVKRDFPWLDLNSQQAKDIERFRWFAADFLAVDPENPQRIIDMRYSLVPNTLIALWGIELSKQATSEAHIRYSMNHRNRKESFNLLLSMIFDD
ncbi:MAG: metal-dependent hydrolase [Cocleimonas sp.]|nr:metal-dependent hydrolase [Cocleimonas sp.]